MLDRENGSVELNLNTINDLRNSMTANIESLEQTLAKRNRDGQSGNDEDRELLREIQLACEQSKVLLTKIDEIEKIYHKCLREDKRLTEDQLQLFEHFGFIIPPGLKPIEEYDDTLEEQLEPYEDQIVEEEYDDNDDEEAKLLQDMRTREKERHRQQGKLLDNEQNESNSVVDYVNSILAEDNGFDDSDAMYFANKQRIGDLKNMYSEMTSDYNFEEEYPQQQHYSRVQHENNSPKSPKEEPSNQEYLDLLDEFLVEKPKKSPDRILPSPRFREQKREVEIEDLHLDDDYLSPRQVNERKSQQMSHSTTIETMMLEMKEEAEKLKTQVHDGWQVERERLMTSLTKKESEVDHHLRELHGKEDELAQYKKELALKEKQIQKEREEKQRLQKEMERIGPIAEEVRAVRGQEQKTNSIAVSLGQHIESLQKTISILKDERDKELSIETQKQFDFLSELVKKENRLLRTYLEQMKKEMQNRKIVLDEELHRLNKLVYQALDNELMPFANVGGSGTEKIISDRDLQSQQEAEQILLDLDRDSNPIYLPSDPNDPIDYAVSQTLKSIKCPVRMEIERIAQGEYMADKKIHIRIINNNQVVVKNGNSYESLVEYMTKLYAPFLPVYEPIPVRASMSRDMDVSRDDLLADNAELNRLLSTKEYVRNNSPPVMRPNQTSPSNEAGRLSPRPGRTVQNVTQGPNVIPIQPATKHESPQQRRETLPPQKETRYTNILNAVAAKNQLKPVRSATTAKKVPPNSSANTVIPTKKAGLNNSMLSSSSISETKSTTSSRASSPARKSVGAIAQKRSVSTGKALRNKESNKLEGIEIDDLEAINELRRKKFNQTIAQKNSKK